MIQRPAVRALLLVGLGILPPWAEPARAALGAGASGIAADGAALHGAINTYSRQFYDVAEIAADGMRVRQYLNRDGIVFAVGWSGPALPNLNRLLGTHYGAYTAALAALKSPGLHRSVRVALPGLVVESGGHLRAYTGRAYLPALIPDGVSAAELH